MAKDTARNIGDEQRVFELLSLSRIDGKPIKLPDIDLMEVFNSDPCRDVLLKKQ